MDVHLKTEIIASPSIVDAIVSFAEEENVDLIIIGTKGESSAIKKFLLGSVSSGVVTYAHLYSDGSKVNGRTEVSACLLH